jgi:hypothetical protein
LIASGWRLSLIAGCLKSKSAENNGGEENENRAGGERIES